jgi:alkylation response protein AidB-like acyl-CoA dehydrogenase
MSATEATGSSLLVSRRDLQFLLHEWLELERLAERERFAGQTRELYDDVLELAERIATEKFAPHNRLGDAQEPHLGEDGRVVLAEGVKEAVDAFFEAGLAGASMPEEVGGMGLPHVVSSAAFSFFQAANCGTAGYPFLTAAAANLLLAFGTPEQVERYVVPMLEGRFTGTMCLSETQAGSSLSDIATRAEPQDDGSFRLTGSKMWISGGEHELAENIVHLVLAKVPGDPPGTKGISLFLVPRYVEGRDNHVVLAGLNHKMGFRGTVNTVLSFEGAQGWLVGERTRGLAAMFHMMDEARIGVGLGAAALGSTGYLKSLKYARERPQGRPVLGKDPAAPQVPIIEHPDVRRMLLLQKAYVEGAFALLMFCARLVDDHDDADAALLLDVLTPIAKSWPSQWCLEANSLAIQVHGGYGYAREYDVEQHYRDNRLNPIHDGTHGTQALDLLGRKVTMQGGRGLQVLAGRIAVTCDRAGGREEAEALRAMTTRLAETTGAMFASGDAEGALANATTYLEAAGHVVVAWMWLEQLLACDGKDGAFYDGKRAAARAFFRLELPKVAPMLDLLAGGDRTVLDCDPAVL